MGVVVDVPDARSRAGLAKAGTNSNPGKVQQHALEIEDHEQLPGDNYHEPFDDGG